MPLEPRTRAFLDGIAALGVPPIYQRSVSDARADLVRAQMSEAPPLAVEFDDRVLPVGPTGEVRLRVVRPSGGSTATPVILYFHGGGWVIGDRQTHDRLVRTLALGARATVIFVDYDRSPEAPFPTALEQCFAVTRYVAEHGDEFGVDGSRLAVVGDSAGGNLATTVAMLAKERGGPSIALQVLLYPTTDATFFTPSYFEFAAGPYLTREAMKWFWDRYLPYEAARRSPLASPLQASLQQLAALPPALVLTCEFDVLRDEGEAYANRLTEAGVEVIHVRFLDTIHDFLMLNALAATPAARGAIALVTTMLQQALAAPFQVSSVTMWPSVELPQRSERPGS